MLFVGQPSRSQLVPGSPSGRGGQYWRLLVILGAIVFVALGCSDDDASSEASTETTVTSTTATTAAPATTTTAAPATTAVTAVEVPSPTDVTETHLIDGFGYSIDYPSGWFAETRGPVTEIAPTEEAMEAAFSTVGGPTEGLAITVDHRTVGFLQSIGLTSDDPTAEDLVEFNTANFNWTDVRDSTEVEVFGSRAIRVRVTLSEGGELIQYQGVRADTGEIFLLGTGAPTSEILDEFLPTWDAIVESITATE